MYCGLLLWLFWNETFRKEDCKSHYHQVETPFLQSWYTQPISERHGPPFDSQEFRDFALAYEFELVTSSSNYPQENGRIENALKQQSS